ncbi:MAG: ABC transporter substrate-binding protein [Sphingomonadaceae bacterium]
MRNRLLQAACALVVLGVAVCASAASPVPGVSATTIVIGQSAPLSGSNRELGEDIRDGVLAYFKKVNDGGGIYGRRLELATLDDANDTKRAAANTQKLIEEMQVFALYGYASATLSRPALPFVQKFKVPFIGPFTGAAPMRVFNKYVYNIRASYADELEKIVDHYSLFGIKRFAVVHYDDPIGNANNEIVVRALKQRGLEPVSEASFKDRAHPDIAGGVKAVLKGNPDVIILTTLYKTTADFIKAAIRAGSTAQMISNSFPGASPLAQELGQDGVGVAISQVVPPPTEASVPVVAEYREAAEKLLGRKDFSFTSLEGYIGAKVMVEAIRRAGPKITRESFMQALDSMSDYDAGGYYLSFSPTNHNGSSFVELTIIGKDLHFKY